MDFYITDVFNSDKRLKVRFKCPTHDVAEYYVDGEKHGHLVRTANRRWCLVPLYPYASDEIERVWLTDVLGV